MLDVRADDNILEIGSGPGISVAEIGAKLSTGHLMAIDRSSKAVSRARTRNASFLDRGVVSIEQMELNEAGSLNRRYDKIFAINVNVFWLKPSRELEVIRNLLLPGGSVYLFFEPPSKSRIPEIEKRLCENLSAAGFSIAKGLQKIISETALLFVKARHRSF